MQEGNYENFSSQEKSPSVVVMGTTMSSVGLANRPPALPPVKQNNTVQVTIQTPPDYKFEHFTKLCQHYQEQKKIFQVQIRTEVHNWQRVSKKGQEGTECREKILELLSKFREAQLQQDLLIEKEKLRLDAFRNCINEDTTNRIKKRLTFFQKLNKQHEALLEHVRQDIQDCRAICKRLNDSNGRYKGFETWIKCPASPAYDYGSIGSL